MLKPCLCTEGCSNGTFQTVFRVQKILPFPWCVPAGDSITKMSHFLTACDVIGHYVTILSVIANERVSPNFYDGKVWLNYHY